MITKPAVEKKTKEFFISVDTVKYILKRVLIAVLTVLIIGGITFILMNSIPGDPFLNEKKASEAVIAQKRAAAGLDKPLPVQFVNYLKKFVQGDLGTSFKMQTNRPVKDMIGERFPVSARIGGAALLWSITVGLILGCISAYHRGKWIDNLLRLINTLGVALPTFVTAAVLLIAFTGGRFKALTTLDLTDWRGYILPIFVLGLSPMCHVARYTRSSMLDALGQDYIRTARAKGLETRPILFKHALRNALIPVITYVGPMVAALLTGSLVVEKAFSINGLGSFFTESIRARDYPVIMATTLCLAVLVVVMNLVVDLLYVMVDPRIALTKGGE